MGKLFQMDDYRKYSVSELICIKCNYRYLGARPGETKLHKLVCPECNATGGIIETGDKLE